MKLIYVTRRSLKYKHVIIEKTNVAATTKLFTAPHGAASLTKLVHDKNDSEVALGTDGGGRATLSPWC